MQIKSFDFAMKAVEDDGFFCGYGSVFGNTDSYNDVVVKGAFARTLETWAEKKKLPPMLWNHNSNEPIGIYSKMVEDDHGLYVEGKLLIKDVKRAAEVHALLKAGAIGGMSIGYSVKDFEISDDTRYLKDLDLWELSLVTFPANESAAVSRVKSALADGNLPTLSEFEKFLREAGFSKSVATAIAGKGLRAVLREAENETKSNGYNAVQQAISILKGN